MQQTTKCKAKQLNFLKANNEFEEIVTQEKNKRCIA